ncbi:MAG: cation transporter [Clostridia bacterium]|nr:cation transporter [Clostridia bacterium]
MINIVLYLISAGLMAWLSIKASVYVDLLDKKTNLSGAFIGGVMLSAVTSLPELFTSLTSTVYLDKPGLCIGNILGSDLFNLTVLAFLMIIFYKDFLKAKVAKSHMIISLFVIAIYLIMMLNFKGVLVGGIEIGKYSISIVTLLIAILYISGIKHMANDENETDDEDDSTLTVKQIVTRFILVSIGIITVSIFATYFTDKIAIEFNLGAGIAGAIFLGVATSLPELVSTASLFKMKNYNIAIGNIIGSNIFNFFILSVADVCYFGEKSVYDYSDPKNINLLIFGLIASVLMLLGFKFKNKITQVICPLAVIACYVAFLLV